MLLRNVWFFIKNKQTVTLEKKTNALKMLR